MQEIYSFQSLQTWRINKNYSGRESVCNGNGNSMSSDNCTIEEKSMVDSAKESSSEETLAKEKMSKGNETASYANDRSMSLWCKVPKSRIILKRYGATFPNSAPENSVNSKGPNASTAKEADTNNSHSTIHRKNAVSFFLRPSIHLLQGSSYAS